VSVNQEKNVLCCLESERFSVSNYYYYFFLGGKLKTFIAEDTAQRSSGICAFESFQDLMGQN